MKYPRVCDLPDCNCGEIFEDRTKFRYHKIKFNSREMSSNAAATKKLAIEKLNYQFDNLLPLVEDNNLGQSVLILPIDMFFKSKGFDAIKNEVKTESLERLKKVDAIIEASAVEMTHIIGDSRISLDRQSELKAYPEELRRRKKDGSVGSPNSSTSGGGGAGVEPFEKSIDWIDNEIVYLNAKIKVLENEKVRRANYGTQLICRGIKRKFAECESALRNPYVVAQSQDQDQDIDDLFDEFNN